MKEVKQRVRRFRHSLAGDRPMDDKIMSPPETRNLKPETRNPKPETRILKSET